MICTWRAGGGHIQDTPAKAGALEQEEDGELGGEEAEADGQIQQECLGCYAFGALRRPSIAIEEAEGVGDVGLASVIAHCA
jgi:hypothetical protein